MQPNYQEAIISAQFADLEVRLSADGWTNTTVERVDKSVYVGLETPVPDSFRYLCRIDMSRYPVDPYWIGFLNPALPKESWPIASDSDQRFWPWSPMPALHGSFILTFVGPYRAFWCRECNFPYFHYHGDKTWMPTKWPLERVVAHLRDAISYAEPPSRWRPIQQQAIIVAAQRAGVGLPPDAGLGDK